MKVSTINLFCWLGSAVLAAALFLVIYQFIGQQESNAQPFDSRYVERLLNGARPQATQDRMQLSYKDEVLPTFIEWDWTGRPPKVEVEKPEEVEVDTGPNYTPVKELVAVRYVQYDTINPGGSLIFLEYIGQLSGKGSATLAVGDQLPKPHEGVVVHKIEPESIIFSFDTEGRENEQVYLNAYGGVELIHVVGEDGVITPVAKQLPKASRRAPLPTETYKLGNGNWQIGTEDADAFANDYQRILTQDVRTKTYYDPQTGRRAGVELVEVKPGSIAARHGAQTGDIIISVNGHPVASEQEAIKWAKLNADKYTVWEVVVENKGRRSTRVFKNPKE